MTQVSTRIRAALSAGLVAASLLAAGGATAQERACSEFGRIRSLNSNLPTKITFVNNADTARGIIWINFEGGTKDYATLNPGQSITLDTFLTHPWMVTTGPGDCLRIVMPRAGGSRIVLADARPRPAPGEEGSPGNRGCPPGTVPVPETDNCVRAPARPTAGGGFPVPGRSLGGVVRGTPDMGGPRLASLQENEPIQILADTGVEMNGYRWFRISWRGRSGFQWGGIMCSNGPLPGIFQQCQGE